MERQYNHLNKNFYGIIVAVICFLLLIPALRLIPVDAQQSSPPGDTSREHELDPKIQSFFEALKKGKTSAIDDFLKNNNNLLATPQTSTGTSGAGNPSSVSELRAEIDKCKTLFGDIQSWEKIEDKKIVSDVVLFRYILKYDQAPVIWTFAFYRKPSTGTPPISIPGSSSSLWTLIGLRFSADILSFTENVQKL